MWLLTVHNGHAHFHVVMMCPGTWHHILYIPMLVQIPPNPYITLFNLGFLVKPCGYLNIAVILLKFCH